MLSYSQLGQDLWVLEVFKNKSNGYFLDIGCGHWKNLSNTLLLEQNGWTGLGIDPYAQGYENRPSTTLCKCVLYSEKLENIDFIEAGDFGGILEHSKFPNHLVDKLSSSKVTKHNTCVLEEILESYNVPNYIDYLSLDIEGAEVEILSSCPFDKYSFGCITVEHNGNKKNQHIIQNILTNNGYKLYSTVKWDDWYISDKLSVDT